jgi:signal transduction histidine kinase
VFFALGWISATLLKLEGRALHEHNIRLSLWYMDAELMQWLDVENDQPHFDYTSLHTLARPHESLLRRPYKGEEYIESNFLRTRDELVFLHFMVLPDGEIISPEVPPEELIEFIKSPLPPTCPSRLGTLRTKHKKDDFHAFHVFRSALHIGKSHVRKKSALASEKALSRAPHTPFVIPPPSEPFTRHGDASYHMHDHAPYTHAHGGGQGMLCYTGDVERFVPAWLDGELFLLRLVDTSQGKCIQGVWMNWPVLREALLTHTKGRLANAELEPAPDGPLGDIADDSHIRLASLPITLVVQPEREVPLHALLSESRLPLIACWFFAALAMAGVSALYFGAVRLSERQSVFVSAVTHELRTPLTTFRLYTEMLVGGMVSEESRKSYHATLFSEATRLSHLVENVLGFARLEKGRSLRRNETLSVNEILGRVVPRLHSRLDAVGMTLERENGDASIGAVRLRTDGTAVEQILFNLADNSAKYASGTGHKARLVVRGDAEFVYFEFSDNGPGVPVSAQKKLFQAFNRSAEEAAGSKPGVGLGLAFSRQLARRLGGDLSLVHTDGTGCTFCLKLPRLQEK